MPASAVLAPVVALPSASVDLAAGLTHWERAVALYASDMPSRYTWRADDSEKIRAWMVQGVARLTFAEVYRLAVQVHHHRVMWLAGRLPVEHRMQHRIDFPQAKRLDRAERVASAMKLWFFGEPTSGMVGDDSFQVYRAYGNDVDEVGV